MRKIALLLILVLVVGIAAAQEEETFTLTILHTNDTHAAHGDPSGEGDGGIARQLTVQEQIQAANENVILLDAGDRFTGTLYHQQYRGADQVQVMNLLGYDAMVLGNHEFDDGEDTLAEFINGVEFPVLSANVEAPNTPVEGLFDPYTILDVNGEQVGVIGVTTADTVDTSSPSADVSFDADYAAAINAAAAELAEQGVNKVIVLTHVGIAADQELISQLEGVDVVLGGHSHTLLSNAYTAAGENNVYPVEYTGADGGLILYGQAGAENMYLGNLSVTFDAEGAVAEYEGDTILLSQYITPNQEALDLLTELYGPIEALTQQVIGETEVFLTGDRAVCRAEECNLGTLITDAMLAAEPEAQIAIMNGGGIRADIDEGEITLGEVLTVLPFGNELATMELTGADVIAALENGVSQVEEGAGRFPQVGGIRFTWDPAAEPGSRIVSVEVAQEDGSYAPIDEAETYFVVTNDFLRQGGDGYEVFATNSINPYDFGGTLDAFVAEYITANSPITIETQGRIMIAGEEAAATEEAGE